MSGECEVRKDEREMLCQLNLLLLTGTKGAARFNVSI